MDRKIKENPTCRSWSPELCGFYMIFGIGDDGVFWIKRILENEREGVRSLCDFFE